jgi:hypothetical protein
LNLLARRPKTAQAMALSARIVLNLVERLFAEITERCVRRGGHYARDSHAELP